MLFKEDFTQLLELALRLITMDSIATAIFIPDVCTIVTIVLKNINIKIIYYFGYTMIFKENVM